MLIHTKQILDIQISNKSNNLKWTKEVKKTHKQNKKKQQNHKEITVKETITNGRCHGRKLVIVGRPAIFFNLVSKKYIHVIQEDELGRGGGGGGR